MGALSSEDVTLSKSVTAGTDISHEAKAGSLKEKAAQDISSNAGQNITNEAGQNISCSAGEDVSLTAKKGSITIGAKKKLTATADDDVSITGKKNGIIDIKDKLVLKCGKASITLTQDGKIAINGKGITIDGGSADVVAKGKNVLINP